MSNLNQIVLIMPIAIPHMVVFIFLDAIRKKRENEIVTGSIGAVPTSTSYRWFSLYTSWTSPAVVQFGFTLLLLVVYIVIADNVTGDGAKLVAYSVVFFSCVGILGSLHMSVLGYLRLASILRQAEAD